ncbi:MAG TPA: hypothetical protein VFD86_10285, partial [Nitrospira sp.]|nr:hypothetical protein [Nitrospira sp.]
LHTGHPGPMVGTTVSTALEHGRDRYWLKFAQGFHCEDLGALYGTSHTQLPLKVFEHFGRRRTKMASHEKAMIGRKKGCELSDRRFGVERSRDTHGERTGFVRDWILVGRAGRGTSAMDDETGAEAVEEGLQPPATGDGREFAIFLHD